MSKDAMKRFALSLFMLTGSGASVAWFLWRPSHEALAVVAFFTGLSLGSAFS